MTQSIWSQAPFWRSVTIRHPILEDFRSINKLDNWKDAKNTKRVVKWYARYNEINPSLRDIHTVNPSKQNAKARLRLVWHFVYSVKPVILQHKTIC